MSVSRSQQVAALCGCFLFFAVQLPTFGGIVVDGNISDWDVDLVSDHLQFNYTDLGSGQGKTAGGFLFHYYEEDQDDGAGISSPLGPHSGGQLYDSEFLGVGIQEGYLYIAIATGQRSDNPFNYFSPGDIRIQAGASDVYGVEVGGGGAAGTDGVFYELKGNGETETAHSDTGRSVGSIWKNEDWTKTTISGDDEYTQLSQWVSGDDANFAGDAVEFFYISPAGSDHAFIEVQIDLSAFGGDAINSVRWAPACNNDYVEVDVPGGIDETQNPVPEPSSMVMLALGALFLGFGVRRRALQAIAA